MRNTLQNRFGTRSAWILLLSASMPSGCAVGPNYHRPAVQTPPACHGPDQSQQTEPQPASFADLPWWQVFHDPQLQELMRTALKQNYDLQLAVSTFSFRSPKRPCAPSMIRSSLPSCVYSTVLQQRLMCCKPG